MVSSLFQGPIKQQNITLSFCSCQCWRHLLKKLSKQRTHKTSISLTRCTIKNRNYWTAWKRGKVSYIIINDWQGKAGLQHTRGRWKENKTPVTKIKSTVSLLSVTCPPNFEQQWRPLSIAVVYKRQTGDNFKVRYSCYKLASSAWEVETFFFFVLHLV